MRVRRLSAVFWATCIVATVFILYVLTDLSFKLPSNKPLQDAEEIKLESIEKKLNHIQDELVHHKGIVNDMRSMVDQIMQSQEVISSQDRVKIMTNVEIGEHGSASPIVEREPDTAVSPLLEPFRRIFRPLFANLWIRPERINSRHLAQMEKISREAKVVGDEPPRLRPVVKFDQSTCPIQKDGVPKTDIQMLSLYERIMFDDKDGGVWKQGWRVEYDEKQWSRKNKLKVFIVPHSHNDPGWLKTFENYYRAQTKAIFENMIEKMFEGVGRKFIWAEISYLSLWWNSDASDQDKDAFKRLLNNGQLEIVTGGWVMNDEANSHWLSIIQQLTTGHQWLIDNLGYIPKNSWAIDPFGHSSSQPYLLKLAGMDNMLIQRVHYRIKKELALSRQLEFKWRQAWDGVGKTDILTHMMPFYSYDVPHTCGPDPKVCCQFDFKRLPGNGMSCPWGVAPQKITQKNVRERAELILDQWRKKAQLYRSNALLVPLGDDFRYDRANEWDNQFRNYDMLIEYINNNDAWNAEVQFGTLSDYFKALREEVKMSDLPVLSGDFFTYADRNQHYWSGYYTSRPFYKSMDRVLLGYLRAAEIITAQATLSGSVSRVLAIQLRDRAAAARRALALFQHHDGVTGTARDDVVRDYGNKMLKAIKYCQSAIQQSAYYLLNKPPIQDQTQEDIFFDVDDVWREHNEIPTRLTITLDVLLPSRRLVFYNPLGFKRQEIVTVIVSTPHVEVFDNTGSPVSAQVSPLVSGEKRLSIASNKFRLSFVAAVPPLGLSVYSVSLRDPETINKHTSFAKVRIFNADYWSVELPAAFNVEQSTARLATDVALAAGGARILANSQGMLKAIVGPDGNLVPVHMDFVQYGSQKAHDNNSGAYLFVPDGAARPLPPAAFPEAVAVEGPLVATLTTALVTPKVADIVLTLSVYNSPWHPRGEVELTTALLLDPAADDVELALRLSTTIDNGDVFYTDLNGMQMIKRRYFEKLPLQGNFYPLPAAAYIEDERTRLTVLTSSPLGAAALQPGRLEIMQDRRLSRDDNRGMNQGVLDNVRTRHQLRVLAEKATTCQNKPPMDHPSGRLTLSAHVSSQRLLQPLVPMQYAPHDDSPAPALVTAALPADVVLAAYNAYTAGKTKEGTIVHGAGLTLQRVALEECYGDSGAAAHYPLAGGQVYLPELTGTPAEHIHDSSLTFVHVRGPLANSGVLTLCPMEIRSVFVNYTRH